MSANKRAGAIAAELTEQTLIARFRQLEVHLVHGPQVPATLEEIGRIREAEYRRVGAGRGGECDLDRYDTEWPWYSQLVSWDPEHLEIVALYRAIRCDWALRHGGTAALRTSQLFDFGDRFVSETLSRAVELGRSVVNSEARRAISGLFSVWVGLGAMVREWPEIGYFFGNISLYRSLPDRAIDAIIGYLARYHGVSAGEVSARVQTGRWSPPPARRRSGTDASARAADRAEATRAFAVVQAEAAAEGWGIPPILVSYLKAHPGMLAYDLALDTDFGDAFEVAIAVPTSGLSTRTLDRFVTPYVSMNPSRFVQPGQR